VCEKIDKHRQKILPNTLVTNIRGIGQKLDELFCVIHNNNVHIACITETWLNDNTTSDSLHMGGYSFYRCDRKDGRRGGGIVCYVSSYLDIQLLSEFESEAVESLWLLFRGQRSYVCHV